MSAADDGVARALEQQELMKASLRSKPVPLSADGVGFRILEARYGKRDAGEALDVTTALRFFERGGEVRLPRGNKTPVLGFCRPKSAPMFRERARPAFSLFAR